MKKRYMPGTIEEPAINLTPLIDVVFVILIMFIVIAPLLEVDRIRLAEGNPELDTHASVQEASQVSIRVFQDNTIRFNDQKTSLAHLPRLLKDARERQPGAKPQLFHDRRAAFGTYQTIKNAVEAAGYEELDIVLSPE